MAILQRAMGEAVADEGRQPRSLTVQFLRAPQAGPVTVKPLVERSGRTLTSVSGRMEQEGKLIALALGSFSGPWPGPTLDESPMPAVEPPGARESAAPPDSNPDAPKFIGQVTMQERLGASLFSGAERSEVGGWLGLIEERAVDALTLAVLADTWFPAPWARLAALAPAPTIEMSVYYRAPLPQPDSLVLGRFRTRLAREGFFEEDGEMWAPDGTLLAQSRQLALLLGAEG